jgi:guanyl-specific ribonuclease Sa
MPPAISYTYDSHDRSSMTLDPVDERGPPARLHRLTTDDPAGFRPSGELVRQDTSTGPRTYDYELVAQSVSPASGTRGGAEGQVGSDESGSVDLRRSGVAAKTGSSAIDALSPAIRSNVDDAIERASTGKVRFPGHDGKVYNNSDGLLPRGGNYTEWTAAQASAKRGADRVIIEGDPANPNAIYYWDHVNPPVRVGP